MSENLFLTYYSIQKQPDPSLHQLSHTARNGFANYLLVRAVPVPRGFSIGGYIFIFSLRLLCGTSPFILKSG